MDTNIQFQFFMISSGMLISGLALWFIAKKSPHSFQGGMLWGIGNLSYFLGFLLVGLRGVLPDFLTIFVGNVATIYGVWYYFRAVKAVFGQDFISRRNQSVPVIASVIVFYFYLIQPNYSVRAIVVSVVVIQLVLLSIRTIIKEKSPDLLAPSYFLSSLFAVLALLLFARLIHNVINYDPLGTIYTDFLFLSYLLSFAFVFMVILTLGFAMLSNAINFMEVHRLAYKDFLTQTLSRRAITDKIETQISNIKRTHFPFSILLIDVDNLKKINDTYGHNKGDDALKYVASILKSALRDTDAVGRYGGDEFVVLLEHTNQKGAEYVADRIINKLRENKSPIDIEVKISMGGAQMTDEDISYDELIRRADQALYGVKKEGGGDYKIFTEEFDELS